MPNIAKLLKDEIVRLARKEFRSEAEALKKSATRHRSEIAALKQQVAKLEQHAARLNKELANGGAPAVGPSPDAGTQLRFRADGFKAHRARLGLSAPAMAGLLGVSAQTIYNWESGASRPSEAQTAKIAAVRKMGKRELRARMQSQ
jgi:DNA-binding transcriptional regulator YiaG